MVVTLVSISCVFKVFIGGAIASINKGGAMIFINKGSLAIKKRLLKLTGDKVVDNIKGVNRHDLKQQLIRYKLKGPLLLINSSISISNHSIGLSS